MMQLPEHAAWLEDTAQEMARDFERISAALKHRGPSATQQSGHKTEELWRRFLESWLPPQYEIGTRKYIVADRATGPTRSRETDLVIFHPGYPRPLRDRTDVLASGIVGAFSVKLTLNAQGLSDAIAEAQSLRRMVGPAPDTVRDQLLSPVFYGVLASSHTWRKTKSSPIKNVEGKLSKQSARTPREHIDVVCVADTASWVRGYWVRNVAQVAQGLDQPGIDIEIVDDMLRERGATRSGQILGALVYGIYRRLAAFDPTLVRVAQSMSRLTTEDRRLSTRTNWKPSALSSTTVAALKELHTEQFKGLPRGPEWDLLYY